MSGPRIYGAFDPPPAYDLECLDKSLTRQSEAAAADINNIMKQYDKTGMLPQVSVEGLFADVSAMPDYRTALDGVRVANEYFMQLPALVRAQFDNDAAKFLDFAIDPANKPELIKMGLIEDPAQLGLDLGEAPVVLPAPSPGP